MPEIPRTRAAVALTLLVLAFAGLAAPNLGDAPLERAEIYFLDAARTMVESGDWTVPRYQGEPFFDKPPLTYWLMAIALRAISEEPGSARLVAVLASLATLLVTAWLGTLLFGRRTALAGVLVLSTTLAFLTFARVAMSDMLLTLLTTLAVTLGVRAYRPDPPAWIVPGLGAVLGLGFAAKGPIALVVPAAAFAVLLAQARRLPPARGAPIAAAAFATLGLGWYGLVYVRVGTGPLEHFFLRENVERFAGEAYDVGRQPWFYLLAYAAGGLPWSPFLPLALWRLLGAGDTSEVARRASQLLAGWVAIVLVILSLSRGKIDYYLLPLYPAISLLVGRLFVAVPWGRLERAWGRTTLLLLVGALGAFAIRPPEVPSGWLPRPAVVALLGCVLAVGGLAAVVVAIRPTPRRMAAAVAGVAASLWLALTVFFLPAFARAQPNLRIAQDVSRELRYVPELRLATCSDPARARRDVLFYARLAAERRCDLWALMASSRPYLLLVRPDEDRSFGSAPAYRHVATYRYLPARSLTLAGFVSLSEPGETILIANFPTSDPVARRKLRREYRKAFHRAHEKEGIPVQLPRKRAAP